MRTIAAILLFLPSSLDAETVVPSYSQGSMSPDGSKIAFLCRSSDHANSEVYVIDADGSNMTRLTRSSSDAWQPNWSPDGKRIALVAKWTGNLDIHIVNADGSATVQLTDHEAEDTNPVFSPDGTSVAFASMRDGSMEIYVVNLDSREVVRLTNDPASDYSPTWSSDGSKIAYLSRRESGTEIRVMDADGSNNRKIESGDIQRVAKLVWSPDDSRFACLVFIRRGVASVSTLSANGGDLRTLYENASSSGGIGWSPDGTRILFAAPVRQKTPEQSAREGSEPRGRAPLDIYAVDVDGSSLTKLSPR